MADFIYYTPVAEPPPGLQSNFDHPRGQRAMADALVLLAIGSITIFAWLRFYTKKFVMGLLHTEDYLIPIAWLAAVGQTTCGFLINGIAPLVHSWDLTLHTFGKYLLYLRTGAVCYNVAIVLLKVSVLIQLLRIFVPNGSLAKTYLVAHALIWSNIIYYTISIFMYIFTCDPVAKAWKPWLPGKCRSMRTLAISMAVTNLVGDLLVLFLTQNIIWKVMCKRPKERLRLSIVFFAGLVPCAFACICLVYSSRSVHGQDFAYDSMLMWMACYAEVSTAMLVLLLPVLPKFFGHLRAFSLPSFLSSSPKSVVEMVPPHPGGHGSRRSDPLEPPQRRHSLYHLSYTEANRDDEVELAPIDVNEIVLRYVERSDSDREESLKKPGDDGSRASSPSVQFDQEQAQGVGMAITTNR